jgi:hypothetical protein
LPPFWWGKPLWSCLHRIAALYPVEQPPAALQQAGVALIRGLQRMLPCKACSGNYGKELEKAAMTPREAVASRQAFSAFWLAVHNSVNERLQRQPWSEAAVLQETCGAAAAASGEGWAACRENLAEEPAAHPVWEVLIAVAAGLTEQPAPGDVIAMRQFLEALFVLLEAGEPLFFRRALSGVLAGLLEVAHDRSALLERVAAAWNAVRPADLGVLDLDTLHVRYCSTVGCSLESLLDHNREPAAAQAIEEDPAPEPPALPDPPARDAEPIAGERRWAQSPWLYSMLLVVSVVLLVLVAVWVLKTSGPRHRRRMAWRAVPQ